MKPSLKTNSRCTGPMGLGPSQLDPWVPGCFRVWVAGTGSTGSRCQWRWYSHGSKGKHGWVDLEMTGLDIEKYPMIEIVCLITDSDLNIWLKVLIWLSDSCRELLESMWEVWSYQGSERVYSCFAAGRVWISVFLWQQTPLGALCTYREFSSCR